jgi:Flp pilus assembly protein TadG
VELALVILPFFALLSGFFDVSFALFSWTTLQNAVREGCRFAITFQTTTPSGGACSGQDDCIEQVVQQYAMGLVTEAGGLIHVNYYTQAAPTTLIASPGGNVPGNIVVVSVQGYPLQWLVPLSGTVINPYRSTSPSTISVYSADVLGGFPAGVTSVAR